MTGRSRTVVGNRTVRYLEAHPAQLVKRSGRHVVNTSQRVRTTEVIEDQMNDVGVADARATNLNWSSEASLRFERRQILSPKSPSHSTRPAEMTELRGAQKRAQGSAVARCPRACSRSGPRRTSLPGTPGRRAHRLRFQHVCQPLPRSPRVGYQQDCRQRHAGRSVRRDGRARDERKYRDEKSQRKHTAPRNSPQKGIVCQSISRRPASSTGICDARPAVDQAVAVRHRP